MKKRKLYIKKSEIDNVKKKGNKDVSIEVAISVGKSYSFRSEEVMEANLSYELRSRDTIKEFVLEPLKLAVNQKRKMMEENVEVVRTLQRMIKQKLCPTMMSEMDYSPKSASKSAKGEGSSKEIPMNSVKLKRSAVKDKVSHTIKYDKSLVDLKVKVWWPEDKTLRKKFLDRHFMKSYEPFDKDAKPMICNKSIKYGLEISQGIQNESKSLKKMD